MQTTPDDRDQELLRRAFLLARDARARGHRPFGAIVADPQGIISGSGSTQTADNDPTGHAEMNAVRMAMKRAPRSTLGAATLYASSEPCAMCAAATFYSGIRRIVFGFSETRLRPLRNGTMRGAGLSISSREVFVHTPTPVAIVGPCLEDEAADIHAGYWVSAEQIGSERAIATAPQAHRAALVIPDRDAAFLRRTFVLAGEAGARGELPFGAMVADSHGKELIEAVSTEMSGGDWTCHAETNAIRMVAALIPRDRLSTSTLYASSEPCVMCAAATFYSGIRRIVFGFSEPRLRGLLGSAEETAGLGLSCRQVLALAPDAFEIHGPCLEDEAEAPHAHYWRKSRERRPANRGTGVSV